MSPLLILLTTAALGVEVGWEPLAGGGHEYTIQIEPQLLGVLERGTEEIFSEVPPELNVRRYRIKVGTGPLARNVGSPAAAEPARPDRKPPRDIDDGLPPLEGARPEDNAAGAPESPTDQGAGQPGDTQVPSAGGDEGGESTLGSDAGHEPRDSQPPGKLPPDHNASGPIELAGHDAQKPERAQDAGAVETQKPMLPDQPSRPWSVLVGSVVLLCCSLGANVYLGWIAWGARKGYRDVVEKLRGAS